MGIELFFVRNRNLSLVAGVAPSKREGLSSEFQSGRSSLTAEGSITFPESIWAPISPAFSNKTTRNSSLPALFASCLSLMAALSPAGPDQSASGNVVGERLSTAANDADIHCVALTVLLPRVKG